jgi:hypothetical protein
MRETLAYGCRREIASSWGSLRIRANWSDLLLITFRKQCEFKNLCNPGDAVV